MTDPAIVSTTKRPKPEEREEEAPKVKYEEPREFRVRRQLMETINASLARVEAAVKRRNDAKSQLGTAQRELDDAWGEYGRARQALLKHLPKVELDD
jgi:hypothetical protein